MDYSKPGFPVHHQLTDLLRLMSMESVMQSNYLILCCPLLLLPLIFPSIRVFFSETVIRIRWPVYWSFSFSMRPSNEYSGLTGLISLQSKGLSRVFSNTTVQKHQFFGTAFFIFQLSYPYMTTGKTITLSRWTFIDKVMPLCQVNCSKDISIEITINSKLSKPCRNGASLHLLVISR